MNIKAIMSEFFKSPSSLIPYIHIYLVSVNTFPSVLKNRADLLIPSASLRVFSSAFYD